MKTQFVVFLGFLLISNITFAKDIKLVVPQVDIHNAIKLTKNNMAVRMFDSSQLPDTAYLTPKEFSKVIGKTVRVKINKGNPIPKQAIIPLWQFNTQDKDIFSIEMPGIIKSLDKNQSEGGNTQTYYVEQGLPNLKQGFHSYQLHYTDYPPDKIADPGKSNIINKMRDTLVNEMKQEGMTIEHFEENEISLNDYSGIELISVMNVNGQIGHLYQRLYQVGYRQYYLMVFSPSFKTPEAERNRFFNSFMLH